METQNQINVVDSKNAIKQQKPTKVGEINALYLIDRAIENNIDIEKFEKLISLAQMLEREKAKRDFYESFSKFQSSIPTIFKNSEVNMGYGKPKYNYATLSDIITNIQKPLGEANLSFRWDVKNDDVMIEVTCILSHKGGYELQTSIAAPRDSSPGKSTVQAIASTITYLKRYTLVSLLGIGTADPDDDAQSTLNIDKKQVINDKDKIIKQIKSELKSCKDEDGVRRIWSKYQKYSNDADVLNLFTEWRKKQAKKVEDAKKVEQKVRTSKIIDRKEDDSDELQL